MSDLELAKVKLIDTIGKYNLTASNIAKFKLSQLEENVFATMMVEFAQDLANDVSATVSGLHLQRVSNSVICYTCNVTKGTKPKGENYCNMCDHYF